MTNEIIDGEQHIGITTTTVRGCSRCHSIDKTDNILRVLDEWVCIRCMRDKDWDIFNGVGKK